MRGTATMVTVLAFLLMGEQAFAQEFNVYDPYGQSFDTDYSSPTWQPSIPPTGGGSSGGSTGSTGGGTGGTTAATIPAGAVAVTLNGGKGPVYYRDSGAEEKRAVGDWTLMKIYARSSLGSANYTKSIGIITSKKEGASFIYGDGYLFPDKLSGMASGGVASPPAPTPSAPPAPVPVSGTGYASAAPTATTPIVIRNGNVYTTSGALVDTARYDAATKKIYYRDTTSTYGGLLSATTGWVNIKPFVPPPTSGAAPTPPPADPIPPAPTVLPWVPVVPSGDAIQDPSPAMPDVVQQATKCGPNEQCGPDGATPSRVAPVTRIARGIHTFFTGIIRWFQRL